MSENRTKSMNPSLQKLQDESPFELTQAELIELRNASRHKEGVQKVIVRKGMITGFNHLDERGIFNFLKNALKMRRNLQAFSVLRDSRLLDENFAKANTVTQTIKASEDIIRSYEDISKKTANIFFSSQKVVGVSLNIKGEFQVTLANSDYDFKHVVKKVEEEQVQEDIFGNKVVSKQETTKEIPVDPVLVINHLT